MSSETEPALGRNSLGNLAMGLAFFGPSPKCFCIPWMCHELKTPVSGYCPSVSFIWSQFLSAHINHFWLVQAFK